jgi:hypothetical protein
MKLLRLATMYFTPPPQGWNSWRTQVGSVILSTNTLNVPPVEGKLRLLVSAEIPIAFPEIDQEGFISLPIGEREQCEQALQLVADLISICGKCERFISSASPCWALVAENPDEKTRLELSRGIKNNRKMMPSFTLQIPKNNEIIYKLQDRIDGITILAESYSHNREAGKYREYIRLFEVAFTIPFTNLEKKLKDFLPREMGYTRQEIKHWIEFRHPIIHADGRKTDRLVFDVDVRWVTQRMEQAAIDVLFNKSEWHSISITRRQIYIPSAFTSTNDGGGIIRQGSTPVIKFQVIDEFGIFPVDLNANITNPPESWWFKVYQEETTGDINTQPQ